MIDIVEKLDLHGTRDVPRRPFELPSRTLLAPTSGFRFDGRTPPALRLRQRLLVGHPFVWVVDLKLATAAPAESDADRDASDRLASASWQHAEPSHRF